MSNTRSAITTYDLNDIRPDAGLPEPVAASAVLVARQGHDMIEGLYGSVVLRIPDSGTVEIRTGMEFVAAWTIVNLHPDALHARYHAYTDVTIGICRYEDEDSGDTYLRVKVVTDREHPEHLAEAEWLDDGAVDVNAPDLQGGWIR